MGSSYVDDASAAGRPVRAYVPPTVALRLLELHTRYLEAPPPDDPVAEDVGGSGDDESSEDDEIEVEVSELPADDRRSVE